MFLNFNKLIFEFKSNNVLCSKRFGFKSSCLNQRGESLVSLLTAMGIMSFLMLVLISVMTDVYKNGQDYLSPKASYDDVVDVLKRDLRLAFPSFNNIKCLPVNTLTLNFKTLRSGCSTAFSDPVKKHFFRYYDASSYDSSQVDQNARVTLKVETFHDMLLILEDKKFKASPVQISDLVDYPNPSWTKLSEVVTSKYGNYNDNYFFMIFSPHYVKRSTSQSYDSGGLVLRKQPNLIIQKTQSSFKIIAGSNGLDSIVDSQKHFAANLNAYYNSEESFKEFIRSLPAQGSGSAPLYIQRIKLVHYQVSTRGQLYRSDIDELSEESILRNKRLLVENVCEVNVSRNLASTSFDVEVVADLEEPYQCT